MRAFFIRLFSWEPPWVSALNESVVGIGGALFFMWLFRNVEPELWRASLAFICFSIVSLIYELDADPNDFHATGIPDMIQRLPTFVMTIIIWYRW